jgi:CRP/FNR family transcriptional regulator, dissimilatory nitrate respiration regulator
MNPDVETTLSACRFFSAVTGAARERLVSMARLRRFSRGQLLFSEGDPCPGVYAVESGLVRVFKLSASGKEHVLHFAAPGSTFLEVAAIGGFRCPASAEALAESTCVLLPAEAFTRALAEDHGLCLQLLGGLAAWVRQLVGQLEDVTLRDAAGRLARYLLSLGSPDAPGVSLPVRKKDLAQHLNLTSETLSRALRRLSDGGLIALEEDGGIRLADRPSLAALAEGADL